MKYKFFTLFLAVCMVLCACAAQPQAVSELPEASPAAEAVERTEGVLISKKTLECLDLNISVMSRKLQLYNVAENADGSCTVYMTPEEQEAIISALRTALEDEMNALVKDKIWPFLKRVEISEDGQSAHLYTKAGEYDSVRDKTCADAIYLPTLLYVAFALPDMAEDFAMQFTVIDETDRMLDYFRYPKKEVQPSEAPEAGSIDAAE